MVNLKNLLKKDYLLTREFSQKVFFHTGETVDDIIKSNPVQSGKYNYNIKQIQKEINEISDKIENISEKEAELLFAELSNKYPELESTTPFIRLRNEMFFHYSEVI